MREQYTLEKIETSELYVILLEKQRDNYRLAQISATAFEGYTELIYSVCKGYTFENYKIVVPIDEEINSVSDYFPNAMLFENEIKELFGVKIKSINLDYNDKFYRIAAKTPFKKAVKEQASTEAKANDSTGDKIVNDMTKCVLCGLCAKQCPQESITIDRAEKNWKINRDTCIVCGACIDTCNRFRALSIAPNYGETGEVVFHKEPKKEVAE